MRDLTIVIVTYNSSKFIKECLDAVKGYDTIVIDNDSKDKTIHIAKNYDIKIIENSKNIGYGRAANIGIRMAQSEYVLLLNPDVILTRESIEEMVNFMRITPECDIMGPKMLDAEDKLYPSCRKFPKTRAIIGKRFGSFKKHVDEYLMKDFDYKEIKEVDWVSGGCMIFKKKLRFDKRYFLYFEDVDFCHNKKVIYNPDITVKHLVQEESKKRLKPFLWHTSSFIKYKFKWMFKK